MFRALRNLLPGLLAIRTFSCEEVEAKQMTRGYLLQKLTLRGSIFGLKNATLTLVDPLCILQPH